jgi:hypothetical protein
MKLAALLSLALFVPTPTFAQQTTNYQTCTVYQETYIPGGYDRYGNYQQGYVNTQSYPNKCGGGVSSGNYYSEPRQSVQTCAATGAMAVVGAGIAGAISKPSEMSWSIPLGILSGGILGTAFCND